MASAQITRFRFPLALVGALAVTMLLYAALHMLISRRGDLGDVQPVVKIEFTRLHAESEIEKRKRPMAYPVAVERAARDDGRLVKRHGLH